MSAELLRMWGYLILKHLSTLNLSSSHHQSEEEVFYSSHTIKLAKSSFGFVPKSWQTRMNFLANSALRLMELLA